jgi:hypothetical protein
MAEKSGQSGQSKGGAQSGATQKRATEAARKGGEHSHGGTHEQHVKAGEQSHKGKK